MRAVLVMMLIGGLAGFGFAQQEGEWYKGKPIKNITFEGLKHVKSAELDGIIEPYIGRAFTDDVFWDIQGRLYALDFFDRITPTAVPSDMLGSEVIIRFTVVEKPVVSRIVFTGNSSLRRNELLDVVAIKVNDVVTQIKLRSDEAALVNKYLEKGFPDVKIRSGSQTNGDGTLTITFTITEGDKIAIDEFRFQGNSVFSARTLRGRLSLKAKGLLNDGAFQEAKLTADRAALIQYYHDRGYIDAEITDIVRETHKDAKGNNLMTITFRVSEGRMYNFGGVVFEGNKIFSQEELAAQVYSKEGAVVNARRMEADLQRVADLYYENGYIFNTLSREENRNRETGILSYKITIIERDRAHLENITIRGNDKTKDNVILREIPLEPGDVFSKAKLLDAWRNLMNLQYFSSVIPDTVQGTTDNLMELVFTVEEQPTTDLQLGLTFSASADPEDFPVSGLLKIRDLNFLGYGNVIGAEVNASLGTQTVSLEYTQRWLFGLPLSGGFDFTFKHSKRTAATMGASNFPLFNGDEEYAFPNGFYSYDDYYNTGKQPADEYLMKYDQWGLSFGFSTGYRWGTPLGNLGLSGGIRTGWVMNDYDQSLGIYPFDPIIREGVTSWIPSLSVWTSLSIDQRDIYYDPSSGYYAVQRFGWYGILPVEREHYYRTDTKAEWFATLLDVGITDTYRFKAVFGIHSGLSFIFPQPGYDPNMFIEDANKLLVDGMFTGRGWLDQRSNRGLALWENWAELRFPVVPSVLSLDFFFDAAAVKPTPKEFFTSFEMDDMLYSFGAGLRFTIPQFPFRFIFAKRFRTHNGQFEWKKGGLGATGDTDGIDFVLSFTMSTY
ncbi:MAG: outer membrane protein assembly factor BamA [Treponema sp.]|jgi:outer membrane protein insertion porin family|nr:outer membrane protein assembly factor BamA [Treponema sp.]